jgi:hypothetical protein
MADPRGARGLKKLISTQQWEFSGPPCCGEIRRIYLREISSMGAEEINISRLVTRRWKWTDLPKC